MLYYNCSWRHTPFRKIAEKDEASIQCSWRHTPFRKLDNQTVDWCEGSIPKTNIQVFERFAALIKAIRTTPIATTKEVQKLALPDMSPRSCQRYGSWRHTPFRKFF